MPCKICGQEMNVGELHLETASCVFYLKKQNAALVAALKKYGRHDFDCNWNVTKSAKIVHTCTCGFDNALANAKKGTLE
jgi:hypothetical protein